MKPILLLALFFFFEIHADTNNYFELQLVNLSGQAESGNLPTPLNGSNYVDEVETSNVETIINLALRMAPVGIHKLPPFDPYSGGEIKNITIVEVPGISGSIDVSNVVVTGLQQSHFSDIHLHSTNLSVDDAKLLTYKQSIPDLGIAGDVLGVVTLYDITSETISAKISGHIKKMEITGNLGFEEVYYSSRDDPPGTPHYQLSSYSFDTRIGVLQLNLTDIQVLIGKSKPIKIPRIPRDDPIANEILQLFGSIVQKEINKVLRSITAAQVDAFLFPNYY